MAFELCIPEIFEHYPWAMFPNPGMHSSHGIPLSVQDWSPHMGFILKGSQISTLQLKVWFKSKTSIQEYKNEIQIHIILVHELYGTRFWYNVKN